YDAVILGGSVYAGMVQKQLKEYVKANLPQLLSKKIGLFLCAANSDKEQIKKEMEFAFPSELLSHSLVQDVLGYAYSFEKMKFLDKFILKKVKGDDKSAAEYYDDRIEKFAEAVCGVNHE
ncbi:MAG: flavodoxin domain-containing protein, partial [Bacillota bacterium]|nr:flavodoxin domain-containing protein [Bacillota bacterium]